MLHELQPDLTNELIAAAKGPYLGHLTFYEALEVTHLTQHGDGVGVTLGGLEVVSDASMSIDGQPDRELDARPSQIYDPDCDDGWGLAA